MKKSKLTGPTYLTILRMILSVVFIIFVMIPEFWARIIALVVFIIGSISDLIDGKWARKQKIVTDLGAFLDPLADKMLVNLAFLALTSLNVIPVWVFAIVLIRDFAVDGMRMMVARSGITVSASIYGKLKTTFQLTTLIVMLLNLIVNNNLLNIIGDVTLYVSLILAVISGIDYISKGWKKAIKS